MTDALRDELTRLGDAAVPVAVADDLWVRGRRARRRDRIVTATAALSVLLVLGGVGLALGLPGRTSVEPVSPDAVGAVPSVIHGVPQRLLRNEGPLESWRDDVESADLAVGRASVAFNAGEFQPGPVVITAADGAYHLLELPGWLGSGIGASMLSGSPLALSPDGRQLAYAWWDPTPPFDGAMPAGVRILDLETGAVRTIPLKGRDGVLVGAIVWSSDSRWIAWQGRMQSNWTTDNIGSRGAGAGVAGRIAPGASVSDPLPVDPRRSGSLAIDAAGQVLQVRNDGWQVFAADGSERAFVRSDGPELGLPSEKSAGAIAPDGVGAALRGSYPLRSTTFLAGAELLPARDDRVLVSRELPEERYAAGVLVDPLGWVDADHVLARIQPTDSIGDGVGYSYSIDDQELVVMSAPWAAAERYDVVAEVEAEYEEVGGLGDISVAVDLMTLEDPTRDFPEPEWPMSDERKVAIGAAVVLVLLTGVLAVRRLRRR